MKIVIDDKHTIELSETKKNVLCYDIHKDEVDTDLIRRLEWSLTEKYKACFKRLKAEWDPKLAAAGIEMIPTDPDKYAELVFSQQDYKCRAMREKDISAILSS